MVRALATVVKHLYSLVQDDCPKGLWAQGTKFARQKLVYGESSTDEEIVLRVKAPGLPVAPTVVFYPGDDEWDCDCPSQMESCAHVAAAIIALKKARDNGLDMPKNEKKGARVFYRFTSGKRTLRFKRTLVTEKSEKPLEGMVFTLVRKPGHKIDATNLDLEVDQVLGSRNSEILPIEKLSALFEKLQSIVDQEKVTLDGRQIFTDPFPILPLAKVRNNKEGVRLSVVPHPDIDEIIADGVVLCGETLRILGQQAVTGARLEHLPITMEYGKDRLGELVTKVLPELEGQVIPDIKTDRLPGTEGDIEPNVDIEVSQEEQSLSVLATLLYGDPPRARIENDRLIHFKGLVPLRDRARERDLITRLRDELHLVPGRRVKFDGADAAAFTQKLRRWRGEVAEKGDVLYRFPLVPKLLINGDKFEIYFETSGEEGKDQKRVDASAVIGAWRGGMAQVPIEGGAWAPLPSSWLKEHGNKVADLLAARELSRDETPLFVKPVLAELARELGAQAPVSFEKLAMLVEAFDELPSVKPPKGLKAELREYQKKGVDWLYFLRDAGLGAVLADDMGLGKTLQTLCALKPPALVVCPTSVLPNWQAEIKRFRPNMTTMIYHGPKRDLDKKADILITTYAILRLDQEKLSKKRWAAIVLDEAQAIKNPSSLVAKAAYRLNGSFRVALSGTPVENRLDELWSLFHFTNPGLLGRRPDFADRYSRPIAKGDQAATDKLRKHIKPFVLRRMKREVAPELPPRTDMVLHVELSPEERAVYDAVRVATRKDVVQMLSQGGSVVAALEALLRLRQAACHPSLIPGQTLEASAKVSTLVEALENAVEGGHKALVFSQWTSLLDLIEPKLRGKDIDFIRLDGSTSDRGKVVRTFQDDNGPPVLLASLKAGGTGLNLTAADHVFLCDPWWNPAAEDQAADRAHRIGQDRPVIVYRLVSKDTVEERIITLQEHKRSLADAALGNAAAATALSRDDLLFLLGDVAQK